MSGAEPHYPRLAPIDAYGNGGFRFAGMSHIGSLLCVPSGIYAWSARDVGTLAPQDFARVLEAPQSVAFVLLGTGRALTRPTIDVRQAFATAGIGLEVMDTGAVCRTYNMLLAEGRPFAAALIAVE